MSMRLGAAWLLAVSILVAGCGGDSVGPKGGHDPSMITLDPKLVEFTAIGDTFRVKATLYDDRFQTYTTERPIDWMIRDTTVAVVDADGLVTARGYGATYLNATIGRTTAMASIEVRQVPATIEIDAPLVTLVSGDTTRFTAKAWDAQGAIVEKAEVAWSSSDTLVAKVDRDGLVRALWPGTTRIVAAAGEAEAEVEVEVLASTTSVASVSPALLEPGIEAVITGVGFAPVREDNLVEVAGARAKVLAATTTTLRIEVPDRADLPCGPRSEVEIAVEVGGARGAILHPLDVARRIELGVGEDHFVDSEIGGCIELPDQDAEYLVGVVNTSNSITATSSFRLRGHGAGTTAASIRRDPVPGPVDGRGFSPEELRHFEDLEEERRLYELLGPVKPEELRTSASLNVAAAPPPVGSVIDFRIRIRGGGNSCTQYQTIRTRVVYAGPKALVLEDTASALSGQMDHVYKAAAEEFERDMLPILEEYYGDPFAMVNALGSDGRLRLVFTPIVNQDGLLGFVTSADQRPRTSCPSSSEAPTMYVRVPSGTGANAAADWFRTTRATLIHEAKHVVSHAQRISQNAARFEESWLEESTARLAEELWARTLFGYAQGDNVDYQTALYCEDPPNRPGCAGGEPRIMHKHFSQFRTYLTNAPARSPLGRITDSDNSFYGSGWSFVRWAVDNSGKTEQAFLRELTGERTLAGTASLEARMGRSFAEIISDWSLSNFLDDYPGVTTRPELQQPSWNMRDAFLGLHNTFQSSYPRPHPLNPKSFSYGSFTASVPTIPGGGADYTLIEGSAQGEQYLQLLGGQGGPAPTALRMGIVRIR